MCVWLQYDVNRGTWQPETKGARPCVCVSGLVWDVASVDRLEVGGRFVSRERRCGREREIRQPRHNHSLAGIGVVHTSFSTLSSVSDPLAPLVHTHMCVCVCVCISAFLLALTLVSSLCVYSSTCYLAVLWGVVCNTRLCVWGVTRRIETCFRRVLSFLSFNEWSRQCRLFFCVLPFQISSDSGLGRGGASFRSQVDLATVELNLGTVLI